MTKLKPCTLILAAFVSTTLPSVASACGGFFCQLVPIDQAAEQIVFRQDGDQITAMVQIQFVGNSEDFSWVVPVPSTPQLDVGSNTVFTDLELATRPQFNLEFNGSQCAFPEFATDTADSSAENSGGGDGGGVTIESVQNVGGYVATVISGDNAESINQWLVDNNYDLNARGEELLAPYVEDGMKFVAVKLQQNRGTGSIQPLIMKYQSSQPVIPIRLTAIAATDDMGVLVWLLGDARAVPENYLHVTPNYTRLDWFNGTFNAYGSYQNLITQAMNEAGGQGFATDYAGRFPNLGAALTSPTELQQQLDRLADSPDAEFIALVQNFFPNTLVSETLGNLLPLRDGQTPDLYFDQNFLNTNYTAAELTAARSSVDQTIRDEIITPLQTALDVLGGNRYMTRLYTTLSAEEMTVDPAFVFNADMGDQQLDRNATLNVSCINDENHWNLQLGSGTGRDGEVVINTIGPIPFTAPGITQDASWKIEQTAADGQPTVRTVRQFQIETFGSPGTDVTDQGTPTTPEENTSGTGGGGGSAGVALLAFGLLPLYRRRTRQSYQSS